MKLCFKIKVCMMVESQNMQSLKVAAIYRVAFQ